MVAEKRKDKVMGRPRVPAYRGKVHRMSRIEDLFLEDVIPYMKNVNDRDLVIKALDKLKNA